MKENLQEQGRGTEAYEQEIMVPVETPHIGDRGCRDRQQSENIYVKPSLTVFSGTEPTPKNECAFDIWSLEVESLMGTYHDHLVSHAIRHSLRGEARRVLLPLGPLATPKEIMSKDGRSIWKCC